MSRGLKQLSRWGLIAGVVVISSGLQRVEAMPYAEGPMFGIGGGASKIDDAWVADLRLIDNTLCFDILVCLQATLVRWRKGAGGSVSDFDRHLRVNAADDFSLARLEPGGAGGGGGSWSFLNVGPSVLLPLGDEDFGVNPYYQVEWLTIQGLQARHIVGAELIFPALFDGVFQGLKLGGEWEKQGDFTAVNFKLMYLLGYYGN